MLRQFQSEDSLDTRIWYDENRQSIPATDFSIFIIKTEVSVFWVFWQNISTKRDTVLITCDISVHIHISTKRSSGTGMKKCKHNVKKQSPRGVIRNFAKLRPKACNYIKLYTPLVAASATPYLSSQRFHCKVQIDLTLRQNSFHQTKHLHIPWYQFSWEVDQLVLHYMIRDRYHLQILSVFLLYNGTNQSYIQILTKIAEQRKATTLLMWDFRKISISNIIGKSVKVFYF